MQSRFIHGHFLYCFMGSYAKRRTQRICFVGVKVKHQFRRMVGCIHSLSLSRPKFCFSKNTKQHKTSFLISHVFQSIGCDMLHHLERRGGGGGARCSFHVFVSMFAYMLLRILLFVCVFSVCLVCVFSVCVCDCV